VYQNVGAGQGEVLMWGISPYNTDDQINSYKALNGVTNPCAGSEGGGFDAYTVITAGQTFSGFPTYSVICPDRTIFYEICFPPSVSCFEPYYGQCEPLPLIAEFSADNLTPGILDTVNFTDLSTNDPFQWLWAFTPSNVSFINGTDSSSQNPQVQFESDGYYTVELTATNIDGSNTETKTDYIWVIGPTVADFSADLLSPGLGQTVGFTDMSSYDPTSWAWSFTPTSITYAEGTTSSSQNPKVQFNEVGMYTVELTVSNIYGVDTETKIDYINANFHCDASGGGNYLYISDVQIGNINNPSEQEYYRDFTNLSTDLFQGQTDVEITVVNGNFFGNDDLGIWIDWNNNGSFSDVGENIVCEINDEGQGTFLFDVPVDAELGAKTMRIRIKYSGSDCGDPCGTTTYGEVEDYTINVTPLSIDVDVHVFLEGPFNGSLMNTNLNPVLPLSQPFNITPWEYYGDEVVAAIPGADIVDWVLVDIRDAISPDQALSATSIGSQAAFLRNDGRIVNIDGNPVLRFNTSLNHDLYIVIFQRNHIPVISGITVTPSEGVYNYNFSTDEGTVYGGASAHKEVAPGVWGMIAGDGDGSGIIDMDDKLNVWENEAATKGYKFGDFNLDIDVDNQDKNDLWLPNKDKGTTVPD